MISAELVQKIRLLELHTRRLMINQVAGGAQSSQRGFGFEFDTLDDYQEGDDIRYLDHRRSAQQDKLVVRRYRDEPARTIMLMVDTSISTLYGTHVLVSTVQAEIATAIALAAAHKNDIVGGMLFAETSNVYMPPRRGRGNVMELATAFLSAHPAGKTSLVNAAQYIMNRLHQRALIIVVSDCIDDRYQDAFRVLKHRHDLIVIRVLDTYSMTLPPLDLVASKDSEEAFMLEPLFGNQLHDYQKILHRWHEEQQAYFAAEGIDCLTVIAGSSWFEPVLHFFVQRMRTT